MIRLVRRAAPPKLDPSFVAVGTAKFASDGTAVWTVREIKDALSEMSHSKCAYCEIALGTGSTYLEVEHVFAKTHHPYKVLEWENLLPTCRRCNGTKSDWDVAVVGQVMIDPVRDVPKEHFRLDEAYRPVGKTEAGKNSIIEIGLDDIIRLGVPRYKLGEQFKRKLEELYNQYYHLPHHATVRQRRDIIRRIKAALRKSHEDEPFSAVIATVIERSDAFHLLKAKMVEVGDWDDELSSSELLAQGSSLAN